MEIESILDEMLEFILKQKSGELYLYDNSNDEHIKSRNEFYKKFEKDKGIILTEIIDLFDILQNDGYIMSTKQGIIKHFWIRINIKGRMFVHQGGYVGKLERMASRENRLKGLESQVRKNQESQISLTKALALAAFLMVCFEGWKIYHHLTWEHVCPL